MRARSYTVIMISCGIIIIILLIDCLRSRGDTVRNNSIMLGYETVMKSTMLFPFDLRDIMVLDSISRNNGNVTVVIPESVCATCFNELLSYLAKSCQEESFSFWLPERGGLSEELVKNILPGETFIYRDIGLNETSHILMVRLSSNKWRNCYFRYEPGAESALKLFLRI